jgi:uncharacterized membrane protein
VDTYEILLFLHVSSVAFWLGAELLIDILVLRAERQGEAAAVRRLFDELGALDPVFLPATVLVLATGVLMTIDAGWSFDSLWIVLGHAGFAFIYLYGFLYLEPHVKRARAMIEREDGLGPQAQALMRRFFLLWRVETVVLFLVVFDMTVKPAGDDVGTLVLMAAVLLGSSLYLLWRAATEKIAGAQTGPG